MKLYIPIKLLALTEGVLCVIFGMTAAILVQHFREDTLQNFTLQAETLAQTILKDIDAGTRPDGTIILQDIATLPSTLTELHDSNVKLGITHIAIIDSSNSIVAHTQESLIGTKITNKVLIDNFGWRRTIVVSDKTLHHILIPIIQSKGQPITSMYSQEYIGSIDIAYSRSFLNKMAGQFLKEMLLIFLVATIVSIPILWFFSHFLVTRPLLYLAQVGQQIAQGQPIDSIHFTKYNDERAVLAEVFVSISRYFREVTDLATQIASGSLSDRYVEKRSKRDVLGLALQDMLNYLQTVAGLATRIGSGDLTMTVPLRSDHDAFGRALQQMISSLRNMANLATQISSGDLRGTIEPRSEQDELGHAFQSMTGYLTTLASAASAIAGGNLAQKVQPQSEYDVLGNAFKTMAVRLRQNFERIEQEVKERTRAQEALQTLNEELEDRVKRRTLELSTAYEEIEKLNEQLKEENFRMGAELDVARRLQTMILPLPEELQAIEDLEIVGYMKPAEEVGGDYYDVLMDNGSIHIGIGDVTGHGLESGVLMLMTQTAVRTLIDRGETNPKVFLNTLNRVLFQNIQRMGVDLSLTFSFLNYQQNRLKVIGQHEEVLVVRQHGAGGIVERVQTIDLGFPLGMVDDIGQWVSEATIDLQPGDGIVLYTDGIPEAENLDGKQYGMERLCQIISQHWQTSADQIRQVVIHDVIQYIGKQKVYDDLTLVVLKQK